MVCDPKPELANEWRSGQVVAINEKCHWCAWFTHMGGVVARVYFV